MRSSATCVQTTPYGMSEWLPSAAFQAASGVESPAVGDGEYGAFLVSHGIDYSDDQLRGSVELLRYDPPADAAPLPSLRWCTGVGCAFLWCIWTTDGGDAGCQSLYHPPP